MTAFAFHLKWIQIKQLEHVTMRLPGAPELIKHKPWLALVTIEPLSRRHPEPFRAGRALLLKSMGLTRTGRPKVNDGVDHITLPPDRRHGQTHVVNLPLELEDVTWRDIEDLGISLAGHDELAQVSDVIALASAKTSSEPHHSVFVRPVERTLKTACSLGAVVYSFLRRSAAHLGSTAFKTRLLMDVAMTNLLLEMEVTLPVNCSILLAHLKLPSCILQPVNLGAVKRVIVFLRGHVDDEHPTNRAPISHYWKTKREVFAGIKREVRKKVYGKQRGVACGADTALATSVLERGASLAAPQR